MTDQQIIRQVLDVSKLLYDRGMVNAFEGNVSMRSGDRVFVTPSGRCKGFLCEQDVAIVDLEGKQLSDGPAATSELRMHLAAYRLRPDIGALVHTHSPYATAFALAQREIESRAYPELVIIYDRIPLAAYGTPNTDEIHADFGRILPQTDVMLLAAHGVVAVGSDAFDAYYKAESVEFIAKTLAIAGSLGGEVALSDREIEKLYDVRRRRLGRGPLEL